MPTDPSAEITQAISRFEAAWARGESPQLDAFIPQDQADNFELIAELIAVDLERRLKDGEPTRLEKYLEQFPQLGNSPAHVVNLLVAEYQHRSRLNPALAVDEVLERFPQYGDQLLAQLSATDETQVGGDQFVTQSITAAANGSADETAGELLQRMVDVGLVAEQTIASRRKSLPANARQDQHLIDELLQRGDVTAWQVKQLRAGQKTFVLENGRYLLLDELGKGGMGTVYRARHVGLNREVALKTIDPKQAKNAQLIGRFQREISVCAKLQHEHIVQAYDMGCHQGVHFLVLEYVAGADLASLIKRDGPMWPDEVAAVGLQIAAALVYAHAQGIVHRDIKPHNILLSTDGISKLLDMGLASNHANDGTAEAVTSLTQTGMVLGTADYMPPEQAADIAKVDGRSDIYSLGATLYYLLTGRPPFPGGDMMSKMHRLANEEPAAIGQLRPDCPRELTDVIERMLAKRPEQRYQSAVEVVQALQPLAAERIAGRHVMTRAVHTAAEADTATPHAGTVAVTPFALATEETVTTSMVRREKKSPLGKWLIGAAIAVPLLIGLGIWAAMPETSKQEGTDRSDPPEKHASPDLKRPPSKLRLVTPLGHYGANWYVSWSADGRYFATPRTDGDVRVWDADTLKTITIYSGHRDSPLDATFSPDGRTVASWDQGRHLHLWETFTGDLRLKVPERVYGDVLFSPDGSKLAFSGRAGLMLWSIARNKSIRLVTKNTYSRLRFSPSGRYLAVQDSRTTDVWDLNNPTASQPIFERPISYIVRPPVNYGDFVFTQETEIAFTKEEAVEFWDVTSGEQQRQLNVPKISNGIQFTRDGSSLLLSTDTGVSRVDLATSQIEDYDRSFRFDSRGVTELVAPRGRRIVKVGTGDNAHSRDWLYDLQANTRKQLPSIDIIGAYYFSLQGKRFLVIGSHLLPEINGFDLATGKPLSGLDLWGTPYVAADGRWFGVVDSAGSKHVEVVPGPGNSVEHTVYPDFEQTAGFTAAGYTHYFRWANRGDEFWRNSVDQRQMRFWNVKTGKIIRTVEKTDADRSLHSYPDNQLLIRARKPKSGNRFEFLIESLTSSPDKEVVTATVVDEKTPVVAGLSADDSRLAVTTFGKPRVLVFDTQSGRQLREVLIPGEIAELEPRYHFNSVALSRSGRYLLYYDRVYDLDAKSPNTVWQAPEHSVAFYKAGFLGDERHVVMRLGARYELWDWQENKKRLSIFLLPQEQWMVFNHETHNWNGSNFAFRHVEFLYRAANDKEEWVVPFIYEKRTQWENEPAQAGLADLRNRPVKSVSAKPSP